MSRRRIGSWLVGLVLVVVAGGCNLVERSSSPAQWRTAIPSGATGSLVVFVADRSGTVTGVAPATGEGPAAAAGSISVSRGPDNSTLLVAWPGSTCDGWATLTFDWTGRALRLVITPTDRACRLASTIERLLIRFDRPVDPAAVTASRGPDTRYVTDEVVGDAVVFADQAHGLVAGSGGDGSAAVDETTDGGVSWRTSRLTSFGVVTGVGLDGVGRPWASVHCIAPDEEPCLPGVFRRDGGAWTRLLTIDAERLSVSGRAAVAIERLPQSSRRDLRLTGDGGATWTTVASPCPSGTAFPAGVSFDRARRLVVICQEAGALARPVTTILRNTDDPPAGWIRLGGGPTGATDVNLDLGPDGTGWLWGASSPLLATADGGTTWTPIGVVDGTTTHVTAADAWASGSGVALVLDADYSLVLQRTTNGSTWVEMARFPSTPCCGG